jgi:hypothetical protein
MGTAANRGLVKALDIMYRECGTRANLGKHDRQVMARLEPRQHVVTAGSTACILNIAEIGIPVPHNNVSRNLGVPGRSIRLRARHHAVEEAEVKPAG